MMNELQDKVNTVAERLELYACGHVANCPACADEVTMIDDGIALAHFVCECGCHDVDSDEIAQELDLNPDDFEQFDTLTLWDLDILEMEYIVDYNREYIGCEMTFTIGGPRIEYDSRRNCVIGYWGGETAYNYLDGELGDELYNFGEELYNC